MCPQETPSFFTSNSLQVYVIFIVRGDFCSVMAEIKRQQCGEQIPYLSDTEDLFGLTGCELGKD